jgi:acyl-CoA dehydrogenase
MDFDDTPQEAAFRAEVRAFLEKNAKRKRGDGASEHDVRTNVTAARAWQAKKAEAGLGAILIPKTYGGRGGTPIEQVIYEQEEQHFGVAAGRTFLVTFGMCLPTMIEFARPEVLSKLVPEAIRGNHLWCQLFSEPSGGSDLAGLRTRAERRGDNWVINGQKCWTSGAHQSDYGLLLTRTDPTVPKHRGLTAFFIDMKTPGIDIRPIKQINGGSHFNEVFFSDVVVPDSQRLGETGKGWQVALFTLMNERVAVARPVGPEFSDLLTLTRTVKIDGLPALRDPTVRDWLVDWYCTNQALKHTMSRIITALSRGKAPGPEASIMKVVLANQLADTASYTLDLLGPAGVALDPDTVPFGGHYEGVFLSAPGERIGGGTEEIMLNVIAERVLGLPADLRADKDVPFNKIAK